MKILVVSSYFPPHFIGGAEIIAHRQARALADRGHEVQVFAGDTSRQIPGHPVLHDVYDGLPVTRVALRTADFAHDGNDVAHPAVDRHFERLIQRWRPDVIHAHHLVGLSLGIIRIARAQGIRVVLTLHDHWGFCINSPRITRQGALCGDSSQCHTCQADFQYGRLRLPLLLRQGYMRWQLQAVDHFISPSRYLADTYIENGLPAERLQVIANGIELERFAGITPPPPGSRLRVLFIGYMGPHKGVPVLLDALAQLPVERLHVDFVGDGHARAEYEAQLAQRLPGLSARFWGRLPNAGIAERLAEAQLLVLPSVCPENQPVTITEAMASGLPVVASRIGGIPELVEEGVTGRLAAVGDADSLATCLGHYLAQPSALAAHGRAGRERIQAFAFARQVEYLEALLQAPASSPLPAPPVVACHGQPQPGAAAALREAFAGVPAPCWIPADWLGDTLADLLWVAGAQPQDPAQVSERVERYLAAGRPVVLDECHRVVAKRYAGAALICRGPLRTALLQRALVLEGAPVLDLPATTGAGQKFN